MTIDRKIGMELRDGHDIGRDPRRMTVGELAALGHNQVSPLRALRLRCIDCCGGSPSEVRLCTAVQCSAWPFRMGRNPWRAPPSEARVALGRRLALRSPAAAENSLQGKEKIGSEGRAGIPLAPNTRAEKTQTGQGTKLQELT